jgi:hypothetical protein
MKFGRPDIKDDGCLVNFHDGCICGLTSPKDVDGCQLEGWNENKCIMDKRCEWNQNELEFRQCSAKPTTKAGFKRFQGDSVFNNLTQLEQAAMGIINNNRRILKVDENFGSVTNSHPKFSFIQKQRLLENIETIGMPTRSCMDKMFDRMAGFAETNEKNMSATFGLNGYGLEDDEHVALMGGHSIGFVHAENGNRAWDDTPTTLDNKYFIDLNNHPIRDLRRPFFHRDNNLIMLSVDLALKQEPRYEPHVKRFANPRTGNDLLLKTFAKAWGKMIGNGFDDLNVNRVPLRDSF